MRPWPLVWQLTPQQFRVLLCIADGLLNKQIAHELGLAENTVKVHVTAILKKLECYSRTQAAVLVKSLENDHEFDRPGASRALHFDSLRRSSTATSAQKTPAIASQRSCMPSTWVTGIRDSSCSEISSRQPILMPYIWPVGVLWPTPKTRMPQRLQRNAGSSAGQTHRG